MNKKGFGWWKHTGTDHKFDPMSPTDYTITTEFGFETMIKYGNDFDRSIWLDHKTVPHDDWYFIDNPELPHLVYPNPSNPLGHKSWSRVVRGAILTQESSGQDHSQRINQTLKDLSSSIITEWQELVMPRHVIRHDSDIVLLCPSSANCFEYYYDTTRTRWIESVSSLVRNQGLEPIVWDKPARRARTQHAETRLHTRLLQDPPLCTVSQHSVAALETLLAGVPAVVTNTHGTGELATPAEEFFGDWHLRTHHAQEVETWVATAVLANTWHKQDIRSGAWHESSH